jgi:D-glycero-alpha-D-manno-heptose-7-phosphate kinase
MIISRTPFRISFLGGGTDYPAWYLKHGGSVVAATIDKYCYLTCRYLPPFFEHRIRVVYAKTELCQFVDDIQHPAVREVLRFLNVSRGVEIHHDGDLPARSGMGSSSAFSVGLLNALHALGGRLPSKHQLATEGIYIEQEALKETVGSQDQVLVAYGGLNQISFHPSGDIVVHPITISRERLRQFNDHLMLFYTGLVRTASDVARTYVGDLEAHKRQMRILKDLVDEGLGLLNSNRDLTGFGELLNESWQVKRSLSARVSNPAVEQMYERAISSGAIGGKLLGAGGGGFLLLFVPPEHQKRVREELGNLLHVPFRFEFSGSQIIFFDPEEDYSVVERERIARPIAAFRENVDASRPHTTGEETG